MSKTPVDRLAPASLDWSFKHHLTYGDTDLFPRPFEFEAMAPRWPTARDHLASIDLRQRSWTKPRRFLVPKDDLQFRTGTQLDPIDSLIFAALMHQIGPQLEARRLPIDAGAVFSSRFDPSDDGRLYSQLVSWSMFWTKSLEYTQSPDFTHVLVCDVADFYQQIDHRIVRQQLELASVPPWCLAVIDAMLSTWHGESGRGVPVGPHAAHLLAELSLVPLDNALSGTYPHFCRFIDDVHIFCRSAEDAQVALYELANTLDGALHLWTSGRKTQLMTTAAFVAMGQANVKIENLGAEERRVLEIVQEVAGSPYEFASFEEVSRDAREALAPEAVERVLAEYLNAPMPDYPKVRWFLRRLTQVGAPGAVGFVIRNLPRLTAAMPDVVAYLRASHGDYEGDWQALGNTLIAVLDYPLVERSEYLQLGILSLFARIADLNHFQALAQRFRNAPPDVRREIVLAARAAGARGWLESEASSLAGRSPWEARAVLYASQLLSPVHRQRLKEEIVATVDRVLGEILLHPDVPGSAPAVGTAAPMAPSAAQVPVAPVPFELQLNPRRGKRFAPGALMALLKRRYGIDAQVTDKRMIAGETTTFDSLRQDISAMRWSKELAAAGAVAIALRRTDTNEYVYELAPTPRPRPWKARSVETPRIIAAARVSDVLLVTTTDVERAVVLSYLEPLKKGQRVIEGSIGQVSLLAGRFGRYAACWMQTEMGSQQRGGSALALTDAIKAVKPKAIVIIGVCFGVDRTWQRLGDVLVATSVEQYEHQKIGPRSTFQRGQRLLCGPVLEERFRTRGNGWSMPRYRDTVKVHPGLVLSGEKLVNDLQFRNRLMATYQNAIGGEMEGAGAYAAASRHNVEVILVKGICDWADGEKNYLAQPFACTAAASFAHYVLSKPEVLKPLRARDLP